MAKILECVPNFSEGRDLGKIKQITDCFNVEGVTLLDASSDSDHNRTVVTVVGDVEPLKAAVIKAVGVAAKLIDLRTHVGQHPRMGATDVVPFIPIKDVTEAEAIEVSKYVGEQIAKLYGIPVFLYERSAINATRENLANIRKGEFEGMAAKMTDQVNWKADFGGACPHISAGVVAVGCRMPLVAFNVNINSSDLSIADKIAKKVRFIGGGFRYCKAMGVELTERKQIQISMNMTDFNKTCVYYSYEFIKTELKRYNVNVVGSEIVGLVPYKALYDCSEFYLMTQGKSIDQISKMSQDEIIKTAQQYLMIENFKLNQVLEVKIAEAKA